jgi:ATP-dependent Clp protease protease subunit
MNKFWKFQDSVESNGTELILSGPIASESWWGDEVTPQEFREELKKHTNEKLTVVLNSGGGDVFAGLEIYNALRELDAEVTIRVDGLAASIASIIAMAGNKVIMSPGSLMMIHRPSVFAAGNVDDLDKAKAILIKIEESIIPIYTERTGLSVEKIAEMLEAETWMSADEAVELGFADEVPKTEKTSLKETIQNALNGNFAYSMEATKQSLISFAEKVTTSEKEGKDVVEPVEVDKSDQPAPADEAETKTTEETVETKTVDTPVEVVEPTIEITNSTEKGTKMDKQLEIAKDQVLAPSNQATIEAKVTVKDYLKTSASMEAFARVLEQQAGRTSDDVKNAWKEHLEVTMGVTNPEVFLPEALITEIEDAFKAGGEIWNRVTKTGSDVFRAAWDTVTGEDSRAKGYNRAEEADKAEEVITIADRVLRPQFIYKYITLNKEDVKNQRSTGALVRYVLGELPRRIVRELERAIVIGDGRAPGSDFKIDSFVSIKADATAGNVFASTYTPEVGESRYASLLLAIDLIESDGQLVLISKKGYLTQLLLENNANGGFLFAPGTNLGAVLGFSTVIQPDWMDEDTDNDAYIVALSNYKTVGDSSIESFTNFILKTNKQEYLQEVWAGGGLTVRKAAVAIASVTS